jgi:hypothetical protein
MTENSFFITGDWPMSVGVLELSVLRLSSTSEVIALDGDWLFDGVADLLGQPSIAVGVARGIK